MPRLTEGMLSELRIAAFAQNVQTHGSTLRALLNDLDEARAEAVQWRANAQQGLDVMVDVAAGLHDAQARARADAYALVEAELRPNGYSGPRVTGIQWGNGFVSIECEDQGDVDGATLMQAVDALRASKEGA